MQTPIHWDGAVACRRYIPTFSHLLLLNKYVLWISRLSMCVLPVSSPCPTMPTESRLTCSPTFVWCSVPIGFFQCFLLQKHLRGLQRIPNIPYSLFYWVRTHASCSCFIISNSVLVSWNLNLWFSIFLYFLLTAFIPALIWVFWPEDVQRPVGSL